MCDVSGAYQERDNVCRARFNTFWRSFIEIRKDLTVDKQLFFKMWKLAFDEGHTFALIQIKDNMKMAGTWKE